MITKELVSLQIDEIIEYENNPRKNDNAVSNVQKSIKQCTYCAPIVVDEDNVILAGHTRYKALKNMNYDNVECLKVTGLSEEQKKKYRYLDNKTQEKAKWDVIKLSDELKGLDLDGYDFFNECNIKASDSDKLNDEIEGSQEIDVEEFNDDKYKYECPKCGFKFN